MSRRPHLYVPGPWEGNAVDPGEVNRHHLRVLRLRPGDPVDYTDGEGRIGSGVFDGDTIVRGEEAIRPRPRPEVAVAVAVPHRGERLRFAVEKLAELGVDLLVWLETDRGEARPPRADKVHSWSVAALEQSKGIWLMTTDGPVRLTDIASFWATRHGPAGVVALVHPGGPAPAEAAGEWPPGSPVILCVGPEGGFTAAEAASTPLRVGLGGRILRTETAATVAAALVLSRVGRWDD